MNQVALEKSWCPVPADGGWDFVDSRNDPLAAIHPYPAKFISSIPRKLIDEFRPPAGTAILDPFCGSGTTLSEAQAAGFPSFGVDLNPIAVMISRVKTSPTPDRVAVSLSAVEAMARDDLTPSLPQIPRLDHWFRPPIQIAIASVVGAIETYGGPARDLFRLALSSVIVRVSNQDSDTRYAAVDKNVVAEDVFRGFVSSVRRIVKALEARTKNLADCAVIEADALGLGRSMVTQPIGLVVTSPPYPNAYEYWLYHKYRMWWLGFDPLLVREREIGARAHFFKGRNSHTAEDFRRQMATVMTSLQDLVIMGGHAGFVVGRSRIRGVVVDNAAIIAEVGRSLGFVETFRAERVIAATRKSFNLSHANIKTETILVMRKGQ